MNFFEHTNYRDALKDLVSERKKFDQKFGFHRLADAARIQRPYMSKVMSGHADLNHDQLYLIAQCLEIDEEKRDFLELLLEYGRSAVVQRKTTLLKRIEKLAAAKRTTNAVTTSHVVTPGLHENLSLYYLNPWTQIVHVALSISRYSKEPWLLADVLGLNREEVRAIIEDLKTLQLVEYQGKDLVALEGKLHLDKSSKLFKAWRSQIKLAAMNHQNHLNDDESYSFTAVFSASDSVHKQMRANFLTYLKQAEVDIAGAKSQDLYQVSFDLFRWG
jgi:uncharacterized protein (TIGR02147 family)